MPTRLNFAQAFFGLLFFIGSTAGVVSAQDHLLKIRVVNQDGKAIKGAKVFVDLRQNPSNQFFNSDDEFLQATSNEDGEIRVPIPKGVTDAVGEQDSSIDCWLLSQEYVGGERAFLRHHVIEGNKLELKVWNLVENGNRATFTVRVLDPSGEPVPGARIRIRSAYIGRAVALLPPSASKAIEKTTNAKGETSFPKIMFGSACDLEIVSEKYGIQHLRSKSQPDSSRAEIKLLATGKIKGRVKDANGVVVPNLKFSLLSENGPSGNLGVAQIETDDSGEFTATIAAGEISVELTDREDATFDVTTLESDIEYEVTPGGNLDLDLMKVIRYIQVNGQVSDNESRPVEGVRISFNCKVGNRFRRRLAVSDEEGKFNIALLPGVVFYGVGQTEDLIFVGPEEVELDVPNNADRKFELNVELVGQEEVTGMVVGKDGNPVADVRVYAKQDLRKYGFAITDQQGNFKTTLPLDVKFSEYELWYGGTRMGKSTIVSEQPLKLKIEKLGSR